MYFSIFSFPYKRMISRYVLYVEELPQHWQTYRLFCKTSGRERGLSHIIII